MNGRELRNLAFKIYELNTVQQVSIGGTIRRRAPRPVFIVFIPTNDFEAQSSTLFRQALGLTSANPFGVGMNAFIELSPQAASYSYAGSEDERYNTFWMDLLTNGGTANSQNMDIVDIAKNVFDNHILKMERLW